MHSSWSSEIAFTTTRGSNIATDPEKPFIIIILQVQFLGTQLAKKIRTLAEECQINSITNQILQIISKKQRKRKEQICVINSKARKTNLFNATC